MHYCLSCFVVIHSCIIIVSILRSNFSASFENLNTSKFCIYEDFNNINQNKLQINYCFVYMLHICNICCIQFCLVNIQRWRELDVKEDEEVWGKVSCYFSLQKQQNVSKELAID
eukprot:TRINITY_DN8273_c0_g2_i1.p3 TRINITY_DN8273_c0_g2~~TRINITY_DN8273_c0_g2_i1.p3  ORF type:complete len:114 (-),score=0.38 TRINITY_DN8273_c0_g2_i1:133-474(-)